MAKFHCNSCGFDWDDDSVVVDEAWCPVCWRVDCRVVHEEEATP